MIGREMSKQLSTRVRREAEDALDHVVKTLKRSAEDLSTDTEEAISGAAEALRDAVESFARAAGSKAKAVGAEAAASARQMTAKVGRETKAHPVAASVAALAAAAVLIQLLSATRKKAG